jgi:hypothetical protein
MRLYHFMKEEYALKALINKRLKISNLDQLNDPFELLGVVFPTEAHEKAFVKMRASMSETLGIICFSKECDDPVQWSHYAEHHKGICLGFDIDENNLLKRKLCRVKYLPVRLSLPDDFLDPKCRDKSAEFMMDIFNTKYEKWSYENEYRVFPKLDERIGNFYFFEFNDDLILKEIILGCKSTPEKSELYRYMGDLRSNVEVYDAKMCSIEYKILKGLVI